MNHFVAELIGTLILILLGDGVVANVVLKKSKGEGAGWMVITTGWAFAVAIPVYLFGGISGAHFNPAVTLGLAITGKFPWAEVPVYLLGQFVGAFLGAALVFVFYYKHFEATEDKPSKLAVFCTAPAIKSDLFAFISEFVGTFILLFGILGITSQEMAPGLTPFIVGVLIWTIGICLGGTTGYAINPARDLGPRIAHAILPIPGKGSSDWRYSWIPIVAPVLGGITGALTYVMLF